MRIVMVTPHGGDAFGQERALSHSCRLLGDAGHQVSFVYDHLNGNLPPLAGALQVKGLSSLHTLSPLGEIARAHGRVLEFLRGQNADVVHLHDLFDFRLIKAIGRRFPLVMTAHTVAASCPSSARLIRGEKSCTKSSGWLCVRHNAEYGCLNFLKTDLHRAHAVHSYLLRRRALLRYAHSVFAISPYVERTLIQDGWPEDRVRLVPNPVDVAGTTALASVPQNLVVFAARLTELKGLSTLLEALATLADRSWTLWVCGEGPDRDALEARALRLGIGTRVQFHGRTAPALTARMMASASVVVAPNQGPEAFGLTLAEACDLGVPVIASDVPAMNETLENGKTGLIFPAGDSAVLADCLNAVWENPEDATLRAIEAQKMIRRYCDPQRHLLRTLEGYRLAIAGQRAEALEPAISQ